PWGAFAMTRPVSLTMRARISEGNGAVVTVRGREAWALRMLMAASQRGCTPIDHPGPRWSTYVHDLRKLGFVIETVRERHAGDFPREHARYVLLSPVAILDQAADSPRKPVRDCSRLERLASSDGSEKLTSSRF